ncbi:MAG: Hpt domain-containing protein, partial [Alcanivoracaceae bacterium]|nr:Hpt domain-containing protein [Alcanivoracaceae bacterium]
LALVEALHAGAIQPGTSVKTVLGHIDRLMRALAAEGAPVLSKTPPAELLKNLLYFIAKCEADTPRITHLKEVYRLADALPSEELVNEERARMSGPDQAAMASVVQALSEELNKVKDALEQFIHTDDSDVSKLKPQAVLLKQVGDTVAVLGVGQPRNVINEQVAALEAMAAGERPAARDDLMDIAGALLFVESTLQGMAGDRRKSERPGSVLAAAPDHVEKAREAVIRECRAGLEEAKDGIVEFIASQWDQSHLADVPGKLSAVRGGLEVIGLNRPAQILRQCVSYISEKLLGENLPKPEWRAMDTLADAITSVEYYLERLSDDPETSDDILDIARSSVGQLGYEIADSEFGRQARSDAEAERAAGVAGLAQEEIDIALPSLPAEDTAAVSEAPAKPMIKRAVAPVDEGADLPDVSDDDLEAFEAAEQERLRLDAEAEAEAAAAQPAPPAQAAEPAPAPAPVTATPPPASASDNDDLIDDEIIEIFVEEAGEVLETLDEYFPRWAASQNDEESLVEFRRAFHTLKGSGRMVGALTIGELAWSIENMMNRVIDHTITPTPILVELVRKVHGLIPSLVQAFSTRQPDPWDVEPLKQAAFKLAEGGSIDVVPEVPAAGAAAAELEQEPEQASAAEEDVEAEAAPSMSVEDVDVEDLSVVQAPEQEPACEDVVAQEPVSEQASDEDDSSSWVLADIFRNEAYSNLEMLHGWLNSIDPDLSVNPLSDEVHRAMHTLKGSARMAEVEVVAAIAEPAEHYAKALVNRGAQADREAVALLAETTRLIQQALDERSTTVAEVAGAAALIEKLNLLVDVMHDEQGSAARDRSIINVFLAEGMDLIMDADSLLARWASDPQHTAEIENLRNELRQVASGARNAGIQEIDELASLLGDCYSAVADHSLTRTDELLTLAGQAHEALITMMDYLAAGQALVRDEGLLADLRSLLPQGPDGPDGGMEVEEVSFEDVAAPADEVEDI